MTVEEKIRIRIRALIEDLEKKDTYIEEYENSSIFKLDEENISEIVSVYKNTTELGSGQYSFDSDTNEITILASLSAEDIIKVNYKYYKYSNTEIDEFVRASLAWISIYSHCERNFEFNDSEVCPTPDSKEQDLIAIVSSILIKPNYSRYTLPNVSVSYPKTMDKEEKIKRVIADFQSGLGTVTTFEWSEE